MRPDPKPILLVLAGALTAAAGCNRLASHAQWYASPAMCSEHADCGPAKVCIEEVCVRDDGARFDPGSIDASVWFANPSGVCRWDDDCGPWLCVDAQCTAPAESGRELPARTELRYWDGSCTDHTDCGPWFCADGWCTAPGRIDPTAALPTAVEGVGARCTSDAACDPGSDCVSPGWCRAAAADEPMTWRDVAWSVDDAAYPDASCNYDTDCGARVCVAGWCQAADLAGLVGPTRDAFAYYDSSCAGDSDCGAWRCVSFWCRDPARIGQAESGDVDRLAARALRDGALDADGHPLPEWIDQNANSPSPDVAESVDPYKDDYVLGGVSGTGTLGALSSIGSFGYGGLGISGSGTGSLGGLGGFGTTTLQATPCASHDECGATDACVAPGVCQANMRGTPFTTADITAFSTAGQFCAADVDCGPMTCVSGTCVPTEDTGATMPLREEIYYYDGSCYDSTQCGPWTCAAGWCRP